MLETRTHINQELATYIKQFKEALPGYNPVLNNPNIKSTAYPDGTIIIHKPMQDGKSRT